MAYNAIWHPLKKIPGPLLHRITPIPWLISWISGMSHVTLLQLHEQYGPVVRTAPNQVSFISATAQQQIYSTEAIGRDPQRFARFIEGEQDIANYEHESDHRRFRKAIYQAVTGPALSTHEGVIRRNASVFRERLDAAVVGGGGEGRVDMTKLYSWLTFDLAGDFIWREPFGCLQNMRTHPWLAVMDFMSLGTYFRLVGVSPLLQKLIWAVIPKRIRDYPRQRKILSPTEMDANLMVLAVAGSVTVHSTVLAATAFLAAQRQCAGRAGEEVRAAFAREEDIAHPAVTNLPYLNAVIMEAFRLCPAQPTSGPRKTIIRAPQYCSGRYSRFFRDPHEFHPERWLDSPEYSSDDKSVVHPFLLGRQSCPGRQLAEMEMTHVLARMLWAFDWQLEEPDFNICSWRSSMVWEVPPLPLRLTRLEAASE
ncbi:cytochrome P450 [Aspergillus aculeatinus CBS 121060]|uniref:Cytochrome P450 n=1 Tax=Aspergillus aculeatinus CBS 121060 TaxID=1448322 RepID=A0ACD1H225_9EURO|nr:cytochrome P450 [Aspergillus aculeatinus CBS 121060]RAH67587.1 cytochrome P450 [Aspergillus aculeatinus CBS 121060]